MHTQEAWQASKLITAPGAEPHTLAQARLHLKVDADRAESNAEIAAALAAARALAEKWTGRAFYKQRHRLTLAEFPCYIALPHPPLISVISVKYRDTSNAEITLSASAYHVATDEGTIEPAFDTDWPDTAAVRGAVTVEWWAGYTDGIVPVAAEAIGVSGGTVYAGQLAQAPNFAEGAVTFVAGAQDITFTAAGSQAVGSDGTGTLTAAGAYSVTFGSTTLAAVTAGYWYGPVAGDPLAAIPGPIKSAILLWLGDLYANRESTVVGTIAAVLPFGVANLLAPYRVVMV